jgi:hypothetical protein
MSSHISPFTLGLALGVPSLCASKSSKAAQILMHWEIESNNFVFDVSIPDNAKTVDSQYLSSGRPTSTVLSILVSNCLRTWKCKGCRVIEDAEGRNA